METSLIICPKIWQKKAQQLWRPYPQQLSNMSLAQDPESISIPILSDNQFFTVSTLFVCEPKYGSYLQLLDR